MSQSLTIIQNINSIATVGPEALENNQQSVTNCNNFGQNLLDQAQKGMNDDLDGQIADYLKKVNKTISKMNERRSPITKIFDEVRSTFTALESSLSDKTKGSIAYQLVLLRNEYTKKKIEAEKERQRLEQERLTKIRLIDEFKSAIKREVEDEISYLANKVKVKLNNQFNLLSADEAKNNLVKKNIGETSFNIDIYSININSRAPHFLSEEESSTIYEEVLNSSAPAFVKNALFEISTLKDEILLKVPGKVMELQRIEEQRKVDAEAAKKLEEEMKLKEEVERLKKEEAERQKQQQILQQKQLEESQKSINNLFSQEAVAASAPIKASIKKRIVMHNNTAMLEVLNFWWINVGCSLSLEELQKKFKSQITEVEKIANTKDNLIVSQNLHYEDEIKAK